MKYKIGDVEKILGISRETIRFLEKKGIIDSERVIENNHRVFNSLTLNKLFVYKTYRKMGFSLDDSYFLTSGKSLHNLELNMKKRLNEIELEMNELSKIQHRTKYINHILDNYDIHFEKPKKTQMPEFYYIENQQEDKFLMCEKQFEINHFCVENNIECLPMLFFEDRKKNECKYGYAMMSNDMVENAKYMGGKTCYYFVTCNSSNIELHSHIDRIVEDFNTGKNMYAHIFHEEIKKDEILRYFEIWIEC